MLSPLVWLSTRKTEKDPKQAAVKQSKKKKVIKKSLKKQQD